MRSILMLAAFFALAACATPCPVSGPDTRVADYVCDTRERFSVTFSRDPDQAILEQEGYPALRLSPAPAASGFRYVAGGVELRGRGEEAILVRPGGGERVCLARR